MAFLGPCAIGAVNGRERHSRMHHQGRQSSRAAHTRRSGMELSTSASGRQQKAEKTRGCVEDRPRDCLEGTDAAGARYRKLTRKGKLSTVVTTALARELSAFIWAINRGVATKACGAQKSQ